MGGTLAGYALRRAFQGCSRRKTGRPVELLQWPVLRPESCGQCDPASHTLRGPKEPWSDEALLLQQARMRSRGCAKSEFPDKADSRDVTRQCLRRRDDSRCCGKTHFAGRKTSGKVGLPLESGSNWQKL